MRWPLPALLSRILILAKGIKFFSFTCYGEVLRSPNTGVWKVSRKYHSGLEGVPLVPCLLQFRDSTVRFRDYFPLSVLQTWVKILPLWRLLLFFWPCRRNLKSTLPKPSVYSDKVSTWPNGTQAGDLGNGGSSLISPGKNFPLGMECFTFSSTNELAWNWGALSNRN